MVSYRLIICQNCGVSWLLYQTPNAKRGHCAQNKECELTMCGCLETTNDLRVAFASDAIYMYIYRGQACEKLICGFLLSLVLTSRVVRAKNSNASGRRFTPF